MKSEQVLNSRMPYMPFNWAEHASRVCHLTLSERGMFDKVRTELWKVVGCKLSRHTLEARLRIKPDSEEAQYLQELLEMGLLIEDEDGCIFDEVQVREFAEAVRKAEVNRANGAKGGRPRSKPEQPGALAHKNVRTSDPEDDPADF